MPLFVSPFLIVRYSLFTEAGETLALRIVLYFSIGPAFIFGSNALPKKPVKAFNEVLSRSHDLLFAFEYSKYSLAKSSNLIFRSRLNLYSPLSISAFTAISAFSVSFYCQRLS